MTTHLRNIFASPRLLAAAITSILLLGILAPTGSCGTSDGSLNYSNTPFVRPDLPSPHSTLRTRGQALAKAHSRSPSIRRG